MPQGAARQGPWVSQRLAAIKWHDSEVPKGATKEEMEDDSGESGKLNHALITLWIHTHRSSDVGNAFAALLDHVQVLGENIEYVAAAAREVEEDRNERMESLELRWMALTGMLDRIIHWAGIRINTEDAMAMGQLKRLERQVKRFGEKLEDVCEYLGMGFDDQDRIRRPPALYDDQYTAVRYLYPRGPRTTSRVTPAHPSDAGESNANFGGVERTMLHAAADSNSPQESVNPSAATTSPQATLPTNAGDTSATRLAENSAATPIPVAPAETLVAASNVDPTATATSPPVCANNRLTDGALSDATNVISANGATKLVMEANAALDATLAVPSAEIGHQVPSTVSDVMEESAPTVHPGITVVYPTPDNSQDTAATHTMLIPPGAINPAGMVTRSKSRSLTLVPQLPMSLPVPQLQAELSSSKPKSTGSL
jgi:hypothetical protein